MMRSGNRYTEAFKEGINIFSLATGVAVSAATLNPLPLLIALVGEAAYLLFVPDSKWYDARLSKRHDAQLEERRRKLIEEIFPTLNTEMQLRFSRLEDARRQLESQGTEDKTWFRQVMRKMDYLMEKFLMFASNEARFCNYLRSVAEEVRRDNKRAKKGDPIPKAMGLTEGRKHGSSASKHEVSPGRQLSDDSVTGSNVEWVNKAVPQIQQFYDSEIASLRAAKDQESDSDTRAVLEKRVEILEKRKEFTDKIAKIQVNLSYQLQLIEDTFGLINDEIRTLAPEHVLADIDNIVDQAEIMTRIIEELSPSEQVLAQMQRTTA
jgi:hypothetical protein